jgi:hypothetical protein
VGAQAPEGLVAAEHVGVAALVEAGGSDGAVTCGTGSAGAVGCAGAAGSWGAAAVVKATSAPLIVALSIFATTRAWYSVPGSRAVTDALTGTGVLPLARLVGDVAVP